MSADVDRSLLLRQAAALMIREKEALPVAAWLETCIWTFAENTGFPAPEHQEAFTCYRIARAYLSNWSPEDWPKIEAAT